MHYGYRRLPDHEKIKAELGCSSDARYLPSPPGLPSGRFSLNNWWAKTWYEAWRGAFGNQQLTRMRDEARRAPFLGLCVSTGTVNAWWVNNNYFPDYGEAIQLHFTIWNTTEINIVMEYLKQHPLEAARLLDHKLSKTLADALAAEDIPLFDVWPQSKGLFKVYNNDDRYGTLAYILAILIDADPNWLLLLHGMPVFELPRLFNEQSSRDKPQNSAAFDVTSPANYWLGGSLPDVPKTRQQPLLTRYLGSLPLDFKHEVSAITRQVTQAAEQLLHDTPPPTWEATLLYPDEPTPALPEPQLAEKAQERLEAISQLTAAFSKTHYPDDGEHLATLARRLVALALNDPDANFIYKGFTKTWACAVMALLTKDLEHACTHFDVSPNTTPNRVKQLRKVLNIQPGDLRWMTPQQREQDLRKHLWRDATGLIVSKNTQG